jgi:hypothetical protein
VWIKVKSSAGASDFSPAAAATPSPAPEVPQNLTLTAADGQITASWTIVPYAKSYEVYYSTVNSPKGAPKYADTEESSAVIAGLENGAVYYVWVKAKNAAGISDFSPAAAAAPSPAQGVPSAPDAALLSPADGQIKAEWSAVQGAQSYEVYYGMENSANSAAKYGDLTGLNVIISGLENGTAYYVWVRAKNAAGTSDLSPASAATPGPAPGIPAAPGEPGVTAADKQLTVSWAAVPYAAFYEVWYGVESTLNLASKWKENLTAVNTIISGLTNGTTYYVWVRAGNITGTGGFSAGAAGTPVQPIAPPGALQDLTLKPADGALEVYWIPLQDATKYHIYYSPINSPARAQYYGETEGTNTTIEPLVNGANYYVWVKAANDAGEGEFSPGVLGTPKAPSTLDRIEIENGLYKTEYYVGQGFRTAGLTVIAIYNDDDKREDVTGASVLTWKNAGGESQGPTQEGDTKVTAAAGTKTITVSYAGKETSFPITVIEDTVTEIAIGKLPSQTTYYVGEPFNPDGLVVTAYYESGRSKTLGSAEYTLASNNVTEELTGEKDKDIDVTYGIPTITAKFKIKVIAIPNIAALTAYLGKAETGSGSAENIPLKLTLGAGFNIGGENDEWSAILARIAGKGKYVDLNLNEAITGAETKEFNPKAGSAAGKALIVSLTLPKAAESIADGTAAGAAFKYFTSLTSVSGEGVTKIGNHAFYRSLNLSTAKFDKVESIGNNAFYNCEVLEEADFKKAKTIGDHAFSGDFSLSWVNISEAAAGGKIGTEAFYNCSSLTKIYLPAKPPTLEGDAAGVFKNSKYTGDNALVFYVTSDAITCYTTDTTWNELVYSENPTDGKYKITSVNSAST